MESPYPDIETASDAYASRFDGATGAWFLSVQARKVQQWIPDDRALTILDVGGGHLQNAIPLCRDGYAVTVHGSDASCRNRMDANPVTAGCAFIASDPMALPVADRQFDAVLSFRLLAHVQAWPQLIAELTRVADRMVIVDFPTSSGLNLISPLLFKLKRRIEGNTRHWEMYRGPEVIDAFRQAGFRLEASYKEFFLPMVFYRILRCKPLTVAMEAGFRTVGLTRLFG
ncbi:MAG: methyltransferase domain-containing protein, partial [Verrucomicrobia bacterium]|nr:methyltransferase domain-containing protein [Verrucomicrobiota bacterium]